MTALTLENPVFVTYVIAAALLVLKVMAQGWMTVHRMMKVRAGWASPEDLQKGLLNTAPDPSQLDVNEYVDRSRRMHRNDLENIPAFWAAGLLGGRPSVCGNRPFCLAGACPDVWFCCGAAGALLGLYDEAIP